MDLFGDDLFARACFAGDQHRRLRLREPARDLEDVAHRGISDDDVRGRIARRRSIAPGADDGDDDIERTNAHEIAADRTAFFATKMMMADEGAVPAAEIFHPNH